MQEANNKKPQKNFGLKKNINILYVLSDWVAV